MNHSNKLSGRRFITIVLAVVVLVVSAGCNMIDAVIGSDVAIAEMVPGESIGGGALDCWLTLEFKNLPEGVDPTDVRVRFESIALVRPAEFDWKYIATNDVVRAGTKFGSGYRDLAASKPGSPPPLGTPIKARFPLQAKRRIDNAPAKIWLEAKVYWGGVERDSAKRPLEHTYSRAPGGFY